MTCPAENLPVQSVAGRLDAQLLVSADEAQPGVAGQRTRQQMRLAEHLETVADAEYRQP